MNYWIQGDAAKADKIKAAWEKLGINNKIPVQNISSCCLGRLNKCGGYKWRYVI